MPRKGDPLSPREAQIVRLVMAGKTREAIGDLLYISPSAIGAHLQRIRQKLGAKNMPELVSKVAAIGVHKLPVVTELNHRYCDAVSLYLDDNS